MNVTPLPGMGSIVPFEDQYNIASFSPAVKEALSLYWCGEEEEGGEAVYLPKIPRDVAEKHDIPLHERRRVHRLLEVLQADPEARMKVTCIPLSAARLAGLLRRADRAGTDEEVLWTSEHQWVAMRTSEYAVLNAGPLMRTDVKSPCFIARDAWTGRKTWFVKGSKRQLSRERGWQTDIAEHEYRMLRKAEGYAVSPRFGRLFALTPVHVHGVSLDAMRYAGANLFFRYKHVLSECQLNWSDQVRAQWAFLAKMVLTVGRLTQMGIVHADIKPANFVLTNKADASLEAKVHALRLTDFAGAVPLQRFVRWKTPPRFPISTEAYRSELDRDCYHGLKESWRVNDDVTFMMYIGLSCDRPLRYVSGRNEEPVEFCHVDDDIRRLKQVRLQFKKLGIQNRSDLDQVIATGVPLNALAGDLATLFGRMTIEQTPSSCRLKDQQLIELIKIREELPELVRQAERVQSRLMEQVIHAHIMYTVGATAFEVFTGYRATRPILQFGRADMWRVTRINSHRLEQAGIDARVSRIVLGLIFEETTIRLGLDSALAAIRDLDLQLAASEITLSSAESSSGNHNQF